MSFVIGKVERVRRRVEFEQLADTGKRAEKADFIVTFKVRDAETLKRRREEYSSLQAQYAQEMQKLLADSSYQVTIDPSSMDERCIAEDVENIEGVLDKDNNEIPFSTELLTNVLNDLSARRALINVWRELNLSDQGSAKRKN